MRDVRVLAKRLELIQYSMVLVQGVWTTELYRAFVNIRPCLDAVSRLDPHGVRSSAPNHGAGQTSGLSNAETRRPPRA